MKFIKSKNRLIFINRRKLDWIKTNIVATSSVCAVLVPAIFGFGVFYLILGPIEFRTLAEQIQKLIHQIVFENLRVIVLVIFVLFYFKKEQWLYLGIAFFGEILAIYLILWMPLWVRMHGLYSVILYGQGMVASFFAS